MKVICIFFKKHDGDIIKINNILYFKRYCFYNLFNIKTRIDRISNFIDLIRKLQNNFGLKLNDSIYLLISSTFNSNLIDFSTSISKILKIKVNVCSNFDNVNYKKIIFWNINLVISKKDIIFNNHSFVKFYQYLNKEIIRSKKIFDNKMLWNNADTEYKQKEKIKYENFLSQLNVIKQIIK